MAGNGGRGELGLRAVRCVLEFVVTAAASIWSNVHSLSVDVPRGLIGMHFIMYLPCKRKQPQPSTKHTAEAFSSRICW